MFYIIERIDTGEGFLAKKGTGNPFTVDAKKIKKFISKEAARKEMCIDNDIVILFKNLKKAECMKMKPSEMERYCFYCKDEKAEHVRKVAMRRKNGYKLMDFEAQLCKRCNFLDDKTLSDYFSA